MSTDIEDLIKQNRPKIDLDGYKFYFQGTAIATHLINSGAITSYGGRFPLIDFDLVESTLMGPKAGEIQSVLPPLIIGKRNPAFLLNIDDYGEEIRNSSFANVCEILNQQGITSGYQLGVDGKLNVSGIDGGKKSQFTTGYSKVNVLEVIMDHYGRNYEEGDIFSMINRERKPSLMQITVSPEQTISMYERLKARAADLGIQGLSGDTLMTIAEGGIIAHEIGHAYAVIRVIESIERELDPLLQTHRDEINARVVIARRLQENEELTQIIHNEETGTNFDYPAEFILSPIYSDLLNLTKRLETQFIQRYSNPFGEETTNGQTSAQLLKRIVDIKMYEQIIRVATKMPEDLIEALTSYSLDELPPIFMELTGERIATAFEYIYMEAALVHAGLSNARAKDLVEAYQISRRTVAQESVQMYKIAFEKGISMGVVNSALYEIWHSYLGPRAKPLDEDKSKRIRGLLKEIIDPLYTIGAGQPLTLDQIQQL